MYMQGVVTFELVTFFLAVGGGAFTIYSHLTRPQRILDRALSGVTEQIKLVDQRFDNHEALTSQIKKLEDNHIHTIESKLETNTEAVNQLRVELGKLSTIIDERIPKKNN